ncbi:16S rRNA (guanine527-N7)-methyltransferase [Aliiroseovarius halocynthiae]|uniref:Ribosomal RNA small subunit methyltransferase G n=1 Tax=Aliiroseovarius halocynthiae TaxID=985055 RepID=A0A545SNS1_9RHOB|nr:16S rRNA (guanine(527)-N(7))-methyltransferase RsmG [Aliiroseovarius halocynthiae]TQV66594.1 16S rRNA (guanine(527)-N(7))-methyltransferase RsmG [Aliiroseovarius halocynthiae]SMR82532.1 16S rRNA (guanine527-N7)-methyltransferase [Aliiroseovarius halocynthiae]
MNYAGFSRQVDVSRETFERLEAYVALMKKWNPAINLVAPSTISQIWSRHILDSAQIYGLVPEDHNIWCDLGSGGGLPAVVVAIMAKDQHPDARVVCIESDVRKSTFLRTVARELDLTLSVSSERIEKADPQGADVLSARALAPLNKLCGFAERHLKPGGVAIFPKGENYRHEIQEALENWSFQLDTYPSKTHPDAFVLKIGEIARV